MTAFIGRREFVTLLGGVTDVATRGSGAAATIGGNVGLVMHWRQRSGYGTTAIARSGKNSANLAGSMAARCRSTLAQARATPSE